MSRLPVLLAAAAMALASAACTPLGPEVAINDQVPADQRTEVAADATEGGESTDEGLTWVAVDIEFESAPTEAPAGTVEVTLENAGASVHNVTFDDIGSGPIVEAQGGETASGSVDLQPGSYHYFCSVPGHEQLMQGTLTVVGPAA